MHKCTRTHATAYTNWVCVCVSEFSAEPKDATNPRRFAFENGIQHKLNSASISMQTKFKWKFVHSICWSFSFFFGDLFIFLTIFFCGEFVQELWEIHQFKYNEHYGHTRYMLVFSTFATHLKNSHFWLRCSCVCEWAYVRTCICVGLSLGGAGNRHHKLTATTNFVEEKSTEIIQWIFFQFLINFTQILKLPPKIVDFLPEKLHIIRIFCCWSGIGAL